LQLFYLILYCINDKDILYTTKRSKDHDSEPCDVHMILARFSRKKIHAFIPRDKNVSKIGGGEAEENSVMVCEEVKDLKHLPPMYAVGDDMLTGVYLIGKATLRMMYCGSDVVEP